MDSRQKRFCVMVIGPAPISLSRTSMLCRPLSSRVTCVVFQFMYASVSLLVNPFAHCLTRASGTTASASAHRITSQKGQVREYWHSAAGLAW
jgi:hypothetical protein